MVAGRAPHFGICPKLDELPGDSLLLIDMPIGLPDTGGFRSCDRWARHVLGPRRSSVFAPPPRFLLHATDYATANRQHRAQHPEGKGLSKQSFYILPKIAELDRWLQAHDSRGQRGLEAHPELAFCSLNSGRPMHHSKRSEAGYAERMAVLRRHEPDAAAVVARARAAYPRNQLANDDILDALALALLGRFHDRLRVFPDPPPRDTAGRPMQMLHLPWAGLEYPGSLALTIH